MDIFSVLSNRLRTLQLETPRLTDNDRQIIQEDNPSQDNERDISLQSVASGQGIKDLSLGREMSFLVQVTIKNTDQLQAYNDAWKIANDFDRLPRYENNELVTLESGDGSFFFDSSSVYTQPRNLGKQEHDAYLYVLTLALNIRK